MVVVSVLAFLTAASLAAFGYLRSQSRDSVRVVHITQIQAALRAYYRDQGVYPAAITANQQIVSGAIVYMETVPAYPLPVDGPCATNSVYNYVRDGNGISYHLDFCLGDRAGDLTKGNHTATPAGIAP